MNIQTIGSILGLFAFFQCIRLQHELSKTREILSSYISDEDKQKLTKTGTVNKKKQLIYFVILVTVLAAIHFTFFLPR